MPHSAVHHPVFARLWSTMSRHEPADIRHHRDELLAGLSGRVIEIGAGTGTNFAHDPPTVDQVVAVEPEPYLREQAQAAAARAEVRIEVLDGVAEQLQNMDERLSIDDFGTGYSSLAYLQRLPVVEIKADRSFVMAMCTAKEDAVIVRSIIDLAHNLGVKVVAEGVEDQATMDLLNEYGCDEAQGYYISRPVPSDALMSWLESSSFGSPRRLNLAAAVDLEHRSP